MDKDKEKLVSEEQKILDNLIYRMDKTLLKLNKHLTQAQIDLNRAKTKELTDAYVDLISSQYDKDIVALGRSKLLKARDALYECRIECDVTEEYFGQMKTDNEEIKIGLHTYSHGNDFFVYSWTLPVCRYFLMNDEGTFFRNRTEYKGSECITEYSLNLKRRVSIKFDKVKEVLHMFPIDEETEEIIADEFLQELLTRRAEQEFRNIVFSIQKKQGEIIQAPYKENLIVQGCAGSGKSMIMMHRLPIILMDNQSSLDRRSVYIITPSQAYNQMMQDMRYELEIADLQMGTLHEYYNHILERYGFAADFYGKINYKANIKAEWLKYIYSERCRKDILQEMTRLITSEETNLNRGTTILQAKHSLPKGTSLKDAISKRIIQSQDLITQNNERLRLYCSRINSTITDLQSIERMLSTRQVAIDNNLNSLIYNEQATIDSNISYMNKLDPVRNAKAIENRKTVIANAQNRIDDLRNELLKIGDQKDYFSELQSMSREIKQVLDVFRTLPKAYDSSNWKEIYKAIDNRDLLDSVYESVKSKLLSMPFNSVMANYSEASIREINSIRRSIRALQQLQTPVLPEQYYEEILKCNEYFRKLSSSIPYVFHDKLLEQMGRKPMSNGKYRALIFSPYLYVQILNLYQGAPSSNVETLVTIDEAQNLSPEELKLIKDVNGGKVTINLFGDVRQHIEETKGIDNWEEFSNIISFKEYRLEENYRNARQITHYCNKKFHMNMQAINLNGSGVSSFDTETDFYSGLENVLSKADKSGLCAIIVGNNLEAAYIKYVYSDYEKRINDMTGDDVTVNPAKWNLLTISQAKGLEFATVIAASGRMTENEKYICYTRALDKLIIFDQILTIPDKKTWITEEEIEDEDNGNNTDANINDEVKEISNQQKQEPNKKSSVSEKSIVKDYFENQGFKVVDLRNKGGMLWVIGEKDKLKPYVDRAVKEYKIQGMYTTSKVIGFKSGWCTKTKK